MESSCSVSLGSVLSAVRISTIIWEASYGYKLVYQELAKRHSDLSPSLEEGSRLQILFIVYLGTNSMRVVLSAWAIYEVPTCPAEEMHLCIYIINR